MVGYDWLAGGNRRDAATTAIRAAAKKELIERGPERFSAESVARRAGCSRATLYRVVGGKKALLDGILADGALEIANGIREAVKDLHGAERVSEAIVVGLRVLRADPPIHDWVRQTVTSSDFLQTSADLADVAAGWLESPEPGDPAVQLAGDWILRVFLSLIAWPASDADTEAVLVRQFVEPAFRAGSAT